MILADKIIQLRKESGWSQEELANKIGVSRQSVSKWEGALSVPDLNKILQMSELFGVTTDYLLKDEIEDADISTNSVDNEDTPYRRVSMEEANSFLKIKAASVGKIALATFLCIISPICLLILGAGADSKMLNITENVAGGIGMITLLVVVAIAVAIYISCYMKSKPYQYLDEEIIELEYGVDGMVKERMKKFSSTYSTFNIIGTCICILSVIPLFTAAFIAENDFYIMISLAITLVIAGIGVIFLIRAGVNQESMKRLLQEGDFDRKLKEKRKNNEAISTIYWLSVTAVYLTLSFITNRWDLTWIVWPVTGVLYGAILAAINMNDKK